MSPAHAFVFDEPMPLPGEGLTELVPEIVLPAQLDDLRKGHLLPEHRLMLAVLEDAVHCYQVSCACDDPAPARLFRETAEWFASDETTSPFCFLTICQAFGIDPDYLRAGLRRWSERHRKNDRRGARTVPLRRIRRVAGLRVRVLGSNRSGVITTA